jgi:ubiquinone/menaquinone biosynthesis C-methylase UbiE
MPEDADGGPSDAGSPWPSAAGFNAGFEAAERSPGLRQVWREAEPDLPVEIEPFSFVSVGLLEHLAAALALAPGRLLVDLACGRGGPGMWLARASGAGLVGVDFSAVAVGQATRRAGTFGLADRARFVVGDLAATGLADAVADAVVCVDAMHFATDLAAAAAEALRILRPGGRLVLTNWQPRSPGDARLPARLRDRAWRPTLESAGFHDVTVEARPEWHEVYTRVYRTALGAGDPHGDPGLAYLQDEARRGLPTVELEDRVVVTARRPAQPAAGRRA